MDDLLYGKRDKRRDWTPNEPSRVAPIFVWPWSLAAFLKWLPGYLLPWNVCFMALATAIWSFATPSMETLRVFAPGWIAFIWVRNMAIVFAVYGSLELWLYVQRRQGGRFKYNGLWPSDRKSKIFMSSRRTLTISSAVSARAYLSGRPTKPCSFMPGPTVGDPGPPSPPTRSGLRRSRLCSPCITRRISTAFIGSSTCRFSTSTCIRCTTIR